MSDRPFWNSRTSGVYHLSPEQLAATRGTAEHLGLRLLTSQIAPNTGKDKVLAQIGKDLHFPSWYGANFDALYDCLIDPAWQSGNGHLILLSGMDALRSTDPEDFSTLIEVLQAAAEVHRDAGSLFWVLIDTPARGIPTLPEA